ncbi:MAG: hypothetical protein GY757_28515 [bacterium]|nr:hypothetical protein [bacterium]
MKKSMFCLVLGSLFLLVGFGGISFADDYATVNSSSSYLKGLIRGALVTYKDSDEITVQTGYGDCNGSYWKISSDMDVSLSSVLPMGEDFVYIYIDDSASSYPTPTIIGSTAEPSWSTTEFGFYSGDDRCIGAVWSPDSSATILPFEGTAEGSYCYNSVIAIPAENVEPNGEWNTVETTAYSPVNSTEILTRVYGSHLNGNVHAGVIPAEGHDSTGAVIMGYHHIFQPVWVKLKRGWSRDLRWYGQDGDDDTFDLQIIGYKIER